MERSPAGNGPLFYRCIEVAVVATARLTHLIAEAPNLRAELAEHGRLHRFESIWEGMKIEAELLRPQIEDGTVDELPALFNACQMTGEQTLQAIATYTLFGQVARRLVATVDAIAVEHPQVVTIYDLRHFGT